jgi:GTP cyclohydrolase I
MSSYRFFEEYNQDTTDDLKQSFTDILSGLGEDITREGIVKTPERASKAMQFLTQGYDQDPAAILKGAMFAEDYSDMVIIKDIELYSLCEHHILPFFW